MRVAIIDYGSGNLKSATKAFERAAREANIEAEIQLTHDSKEVQRAERIVLPGVGAFAACRAGLDAVPDMVSILHEKVVEQGAPFLGICVGAQLMAERGLEKTTTPGLGWIKGDVVQIQPQDHGYKIPQIGWNTLKIQQAHPVLKDIELGADGFHAYFVHSYHIQAEQTQDIIATCDYGCEVTALVAKDNMVGAQFHPEKSQSLGLQLIANFLRWKP